MTMTLLREISDRAKVGNETRAFATTVEMRADDESDGLTFDGIASVVDTAYSVRDMFGDYQETIAKGAFNRTLSQKADVRLLVNHAGVPMARTKSKTLNLTAAPDLRAVAKLDPTNPTVQEIRSAMGRGDIDQMSIGFRVKDQEWSDDYTERTIREIELHDVSIVTYPASTTTSAQLRSFDEFLDEIAAGELTEDEIERGYKFFTDKRAALTPVVDYSERDRQDRERLERLRLLRPVAAV